MDCLLYTCQIQYLKSHQIARRLVPIPSQPHVHLMDHQVLTHHLATGLLLLDSVTWVAHVPLLTHHIVLEHFLHMELVQEHTKLKEELKASDLQMDLSTVYLFHPPSS